MFASGLAALLMLGAAVYVVVEAIGRIGERVAVDTGPMLVVGALGLVVNIIAMALLRGGAAESLNVKGAYLEVVADRARMVLQDRHGIAHATLQVEPRQARDCGDPGW